MGGMVAQELALRHPRRVDRLVLVGTWARPDAKRRLLLEHWRDLARAGASIQTLVRERLLWTLQDDTLEQQDLIDAMVEFFTRDGTPLSADVFARQCEACLQHDSADRLRQIRQRTLVVCGRQDALTPPKFHRELADEIPGAQLVTITLRRAPGDGRVGGELQPHRAPVPRRRAQLTRSEHARRRAEGVRRGVGTANGLGSARARQRSSPRERAHAQPAERRREQRLARQRAAQGQRRVAGRAADQHAVVEVRDARGTA